MMNGGANPALLRIRARHYRHIATHELESERAALFCELAKALELDADARETGTLGHASGWLVALNLVAVPSLPPESLAGC